MKKAAIPAVILGLILAGIVLALGAKRGWFSPKVDDTGAVEQPEKCRRPKPPRHDDSREVITSQGLQRLQSLKKAGSTDLARALEQWGRQTGLERRISWEAVRKGAGEKDRRTRVRACRLAQVLAAGKPDGRPGPPPADPGSVEPLLTCLKSGDPEAVRAAILALGTIHLNNPVLKVREKMLPKVKKSLAGDDPELSRAAMSAVPLLKEVKMAPEVLAAWERHQAVKGYADDVRQHLKILLELQLRENLKQENPGWSKQKCVAGARGKAQEMAGKFGKNRAEWEEYWTGVLKAPEPKP